ncbi:MAG: phosphatidylglycerophosphatase A [Acidobacteriota bacterium]
MSGEVAERLARWLATGLGAGFLWPAPGTWGSLLGLALYVFLLSSLSIPLQLVGWLSLTLVGTAAAHAAAPSLGGGDPSQVVIDEIAAMWLAAVGTVGGPGWSLAFVYFRLFDIIKPFPARRLERWHGGFGIMADDIAAALYARAGVWLTLALWGS